MIIYQAVNFDIVNTIIQVIGLLFVILGIIYAAEQLKSSAKSHKETLEWNKNTFTEAELANKPDRERTSTLNNLFNTSSLSGPISLEKINAEIQKNKDVKSHIHHLLNKYERIARGLKHGIYNEKLVRDASRNTMIKIYTNYSEYINERRKFSSRAWWLFGKLVEKWKEK